MTSRLLLFTVLLLFFCLTCDAHAKGLRDEYKAILASKCAAVKNGATEERDLTWGCVQEKSQQLEKFRIKLETLLEQAMKSQPLDQGGDLKSTHEFKGAWENYKKASGVFGMDFHMPGSGGTSLRLKSEQEMIKQRIELLLQYLLDYYKLDGIS